MATNRRQFMKSAIAAPIAASAASLPAIAQDLPAVVAAPEPYPFSWYFSNYGDIYDEEFDTKEQALAYLRNVGEGMISECQRRDYDLSVDGWRILELINDDNEEARGEGEGIECTNEQERDLGEMVTAAVVAWARKHNIDTAAWTFGVVRNTIVAKEVVETPPAPLIVSGKLG